MSEAESLIVGTESELLCLGTASVWKFLCPIEGQSDNPWVTSATANEGTGHLCVSAFPSGKERHASYLEQNYGSAQLMEGLEGQALG